MLVGDNVGFHKQCGFPAETSIFQFTRDGYNRSAPSGLRMHLRRLLFAIFVYLFGNCGTGDCKPKFMFFQIIKIHLII